MDLDVLLLWAVVTITTVGYGDYYPVTAVGRVIAVFVMFSGIGIVVLLVGTLSNRRLRASTMRLTSKTEVQRRLLGDATKTAIKNKIEEIEKLTEGLQMLSGVGNWIPLFGEPGYQLVKVPSYPSGITTANVYTVSILCCFLHFRQAFLNKNNGFLLLYSVGLAVKNCSL